MDKFLITFAFRQTDSYLRVEKRKKAQEEAKAKKTETGYFQQIHKLKL